jgi:hypothetical protein
MTQYRKRSASLISLLLLVLLARALIPVGFMPAGDGSAELTLCPDGMLMPADAGMPGSGHLHADHCPFGAAPFAAPLATAAAIPQLAATISLPGFESSTWLAATRAARSHQPRAPPV